MSKLYNQTTFLKKGDKNAVYSISYDISQHSRVSYDEIEETLKKNCSEAVNTQQRLGLLNIQAMQKFVTKTFMDLEKMTDY